MTRNIRLLFDPRRRPRLGSLALRSRGARVVRESLGSRGAVQAKAKGRLGRAKLAQMLVGDMMKAWWVRQSESIHRTIRSLLLVPRIGARPRPTQVVAWSVGSIL